MTTAGKKFMQKHLILYKKIRGINEKMSGKSEKILSGLKKFLFEKFTHIKFKILSKITVFFSL